MARSTTPGLNKRVWVGESPPRLVDPATQPHRPFKGGASQGSSLGSLRRFLPPRSRTFPGSTWPASPPVSHSSAARDAGGAHRGMMDSQEEPAAQRTATFSDRRPRSSLIADHDNR